MCTSPLEDDDEGDFDDADPLEPVAGQVSLLTHVYIDTHTHYPVNNAIEVSGGVMTAVWMRECR